MIFKLKYNRPKPIAFNFISGQMQLKLQFRPENRLLLSFNSAPPVEAEFFAVPLVACRE